MTIDSQNLSRLAQPLIVEFRRGVGSPPKYGSSWFPVWDAKVDRVEINHGARPSVATIWFPTIRWHESPPFSWGDMVRIKTIHNNPSIVFVGYVTNRSIEFSGGSERPGAGFERNAVVCLDQRWVIAACSIIFGQLARSPDDYDDDGVPKVDGYTYLIGQRLIFNPNGKFNKDPRELTSAYYPDMPIFCNPGETASSPVGAAAAWTARDMVRYLLNPSWRKLSDYLYVPDPAQLVGLEVVNKDTDKDNWGKVLNHIVIEGLNTMEAVELVCKHIGWDFRLDYYGDTTTIVFYKTGVRDKFIRSGTSVISHNLHAPAEGENIAAAIAEGRKFLWSMSLAQDIAPVVNNPFALGAPHRFEFTAELVPGWKDSDLVYSLSPIEDLCKTDAELQDEINPDAILYYTRYHARGAAHNASPTLRNIGRKWVLNETGAYTAGATPAYDRGEPFKWETIIPPDYILDKAKKRLYARYNRKLLPCLTTLQDGLSSVGIKLEFSFDSGVTWQVIPCSVRLLDNECGIFIEEPNLAEIVDKKEAAISGGALDEVQLNLYTSLVDDKDNARVYKDRFDGGASPWHTRVRVTASVQMDLRVIAIAKPSPSSGSPFDQSQIYDWSDKYGLAKRTESSVFKAGFLGAREFDSRNEATAHVESIRRNNEDMSISGRFTLDRLWLGEGQGYPEFMVGDSIIGITGREYSLDLLTFEGGKVAPEIIQIIYLPETQKQVLITRDLRFATFTNER